MRFRGIIFLLILVCGRDPGLAHGSLHPEIDRLSAAIREHPEDARLRLQRADLWRLDGDVERSLADLAAAARLDPKLDGVGWVRGRLWADHGRPQDALGELDRWLSNHPAHEAALRVRAQVRATLKDYAGAVEDYSRAIASAAQPGPDLFVERARVQQTLGEGHLMEALEGLNAGISRLGGLVVLQLEALQIERRLGMTDAALRRLDRLTEQAARKELWHVRRAELLAEAGRDAEAREAWRAVLADLHRLPESQRSTRVMRDLERRATAVLGAAETIPATADPRPSSAASAAPFSQKSVIRTLPEHASLLP